MDKFNTSLLFVLKREGGYANNPRDKGGETFKGISRRFWPKWEGWKLIDLMKSRAGFPKCAEDDGTLSELVKAFYLTEFWNAIRGDDMPLPWGLAVLDASVNQGTRNAVGMMQTAIGGLKVDSVIGPNTCEAVWTAGPTAMKRFLAKRACRYVRTIMKTPDQEVWANDWMYRLFSVAETVFMMPGTEWVKTAAWH